MSLEQLKTLDEVQKFLDGTQSVAFCVATTKQERYQWVQNTLVTFRYMQSLNKVDKGLITRLLMKVTGYSRAQIKRLIQQYRTIDVITVKLSKGNGFKWIYTKKGIRLLA